MQETGIRLIIFFLYCLRMGRIVILSVVAKYIMGIEVNYV